MPSHLLLLELGNRSYGFLVSGRCRYSGVERAGRLDRSYVSRRRLAPP
jgi:hypothetical protein